MRKLRVLAVNGSPRKNGNTAALLRKAMEGAESQGAETGLVHLYDLDFKGCISCFACKRKESYRDGKCAMRDGLTPILDRAVSSDVLLMGSPIYLSDVTGAMRSFWERLLFMNGTYDTERFTVFEGSVSCGIIYTMNLREKMMEQMGYRRIFEINMQYLKVLNGCTEYLTSTDTYQFDDYSKYHAPQFDESHKARVRAEQFPKDCEVAFLMGAGLAAGKARSPHSASPEQGQQPRMVESGARKMAGLRVRTTLRRHAEDTRELWPRFMKAKKDVKNRLGAEIYSIQIFDPEARFDDADAEFEKWAAVEVSAYEDLPEGFEALAMQGGLYAVFVHRGLPGLSTHDYIFRQWLPSSEYLPDDRAQFEVMQDGYRPDDPDAEEEVWIPVRKA